MPTSDVTGLLSSQMEVCNSRSHPPICLLREMPGAHTHINRVGKRQAYKSEGMVVCRFFRVRRPFTSRPSYSKRCSVYLYAH